MPISEFLDQKSSEKLIKRLTSLADSGSITRDELQTAALWWRTANRLIAKLEEDDANATRGGKAGGRPKDEKIESRRKAWREKYEALMSAEPTLKKKAAAARLDISPDQLRGALGDKKKRKRASVAPT